MALHPRFVFLAPVILLAACGGGGGGGAAQPTSTASVHLLLDPAAGNAATVQSQAISATLRQADGSMTGNLLAAPQNVALSRPSGEAEPLELRHVPDGVYHELHVTFAPGTGTAQFEDGSHHSVDLSSPTIVIPLEDSLHHASGHDSWISMRHSRTEPLQASGSRHQWAPALAARPAAGDSIEGTEMHVVSRTANGFAATIPGDDHGVVHVEFEAESEFYDDHGGRRGGRDDFLGGVRVGDDVFVGGALQSDGTVRGRRMRHHGDGSIARVVGRATSLDAVALTFEMDVLGSVEHGHRSVAQTVEHVVVTVGTAPIRDSRTQASLAFADLAIGARLKVAIASRDGSNVVAREIEVESRDGLPGFPEIEGRVGSVDLQANTITVLPRGNDPLVVNGQPVSSATIQVGAATQLFRLDRNGGGAIAIPIANVLPNQDRIWVRGAVDANGVVQASWVRVRQD